MATVSFEDAIASLRSMFPSFDQGVIEAVLEMNRGAMEPTVEQLLTMDPDQGAASLGLQRVSNNVGPAAPPASIGVGVPVTEPSGRIGPSSSAAQTSSGGTSRRQRRQLPPDFLVLPSEIVTVAAMYGAGVPPTGVSGASARPVAAPSAGMLHAPTFHPTTGQPMNQLEQDEVLASMLQNQLFLEQVQSDPEFAAYLRANPQAAAALGIPIPPGMAPPPMHQGQQRRREAIGVPGAASPAPSAGAAGSTGTSNRISGFGSSSGGGTATATKPSAGGDFGSFMGGLGTDMRRKLDSLAARFRRGQGTASMPATSSSWTGGRGQGATFGAAATGSSAAGGGLAARFTSMFDGRGQYTSLNSAGVDADGAEAVPMYRDDDEGGRSPALGSRPSSRLDRVAKMGGSPAPTGFGGSPPPGISRRTDATAGGAGAVDNGLVEIEFNLDGPGAPSASGAAAGKGGRAPVRDVFAIDDDEDESEHATLSRSGGPSGAAAGGRSKHV